MADIDHRRIDVRFVPIPDVIARRLRIIAIGCSWVQARPSQCGGTGKTLVE
jgi:hypothetical protein